MAYKALYRSYRPNSFGTVIGQEHIIKTLKNALITNKTSHAYIFSGPRGIGKTTIARILAKAINCEDLQNGEPCNKCASCRLINNNETPDIIELDAASNNGVDEIRAVLEKVNFLPGVLKNKVYIIDEVHMLSISAFNALLKTLEEPPVHVMFILATTEPHKIPATILSRCQRFDFKPLTVKEIKTNLKNIAEKEKIAIEEDALNLVAEASDGGMRDAIGILDQVNAYSTTDITIDDVNSVTGRISNQKIIELMQAINEGSSAKAVDLTNDLLAIGKEPSRLVQSLLQLCRDILLYQSTDGEVNDKVIYDDIAFKMLTNTINKKKIFCYIDILSDVQNKIKYSLSQKIFLEVGIMKMSNTTREDYESQVVIDGNNMTGAVLNTESEERISNLEAHLNKLKSELKWFAFLCMDIKII
jgi:DNA polymerase-3 subunit gamma/tau